MRMSPGFAEFTARWNCSGVIIAQVPAEPHDSGHTSPQKAHDLPMILHRTSNWLSCTAMVTPGPTA